MGKRSRQFEEEERSISCRVCDEDIALDFYLDRGDLVTCDGCNSEFIIKSRSPVVLFLLVDDEVDDEEEDDEYYCDDEFFDDEEPLGRNYD